MFISGKYTLYSLNSLVIFSLNGVEYSNSVSYPKKRDMRFLTTLLFVLLTMLSCQCSLLLVRCRSFNCLYYKPFSLYCQYDFKLFLLYFNLNSLYCTHNKSTYYLLSRCFKILYHQDNEIVKYNFLPFPLLFLQVLLV